ncbi:hypothetical protein Sru01_58040 [Sphaerisporangium rufum]|uniref:Uncharacterized protein n=1 Tax=Sphaerisporangium rufum TaxID=1381558 RepID=A0A919R6Y6_9ACTN|nr:hypothetical protein [Sphaerisporangium rufum]GII80822.1 hypothetical protein Sru01_58040 [Sphaerisporangium rufum]
MAWRPTLVLMLLAPYLGEVLSTATSPLALVLPWNLALFAALYGGGALLCRELAHRWGLGLPGLALLGAAYGVYEEALVTRYWFDPGYARDTGVGGHGYGRAAGVDAGAVAVGVEPGTGRGGGVGVADDVEPVGTGPAGDPAGVPGAVGAGVRGRSGGGGAVGGRGWPGRHPSLAAAGL